MTRPLGSRQRDMLLMLANPGIVLIVPDKVSASLVRLGLLRANAGGSCCIASNGLRALADEMDAGRVPDAFEALKSRPHPQSGANHAL